ncbi:MAG TPA: hypothetical protein VGE93_22790 [Bryobacteraceae bacterium]
MCRDTETAGLITERAFIRQGNLNWPTSLLEAGQQVEQATLAAAEI